jgi:SAM-dependent methyltransferase
VDKNEQQRAFYNSRVAAKGGDESAANWLTNRWRALRRSLLRSEYKLGLREQTLDLHRKWLGDLSNKRVLDLGCYTGTDLSVPIARAAKAYVGLDLSDAATATLQSKLESIESASAIAGDFLTHDFKKGEFDLIYAQGVLHHFQDLDGLCRRLYHVLAPGGAVISLDPLQTEPINRLMRILYRPFQSDKDWEWPFSRKSFRILQRYFTIDAIQGDRGLSKIGFFFPPLSEWGMRMDQKYATRLSIYFYHCWRVTMKLARRPSIRSDF